MLVLPIVFAASASFPIPMLLLAVFAFKATLPIATLSEPVRLDSNAELPIATLSLPSVLVPKES